MKVCTGKESEYVNRIVNHITLEVTDFVADAEMLHFLLIVI
jgi:hypothetical protein